MNAPDPPKLLLDANVFRDLADGNLGVYEARLLEVASFRSPPLLWVCPTTFDEIVSHIRAEEAARFPHFREALRWMDRLCGNAGMAEDFPWILWHGLFVGSAPYDKGELSVLLNQLRRELIKAQRFEEVSQENIEAILWIRQDAKRRIDKWAEGKRELHEKARPEPKPGEPRIEGKVAMASAILDSSRKYAEYV
jgi:hypothetical protein